jgi:hypothetical protein
MMQQIQAGLQIGHGFVSSHPFAHHDSDFPDQFHALDLRAGETRDLDGAGLIDGVLDLA